LRLYYDQWLATLPDEDDPAIAHTFSKRFERRMARLVARQRKPYYPIINRPWKRALLAAVIALLLIFAAMSVSAVRERVIAFFVEVYEFFSTVVVKNDPAIKAVNDRAYLITELPEGFELRRSEHFDGNVRLEYWNQEGNGFFFRQYSPNAIQLTIDTENIGLEEIALKGVTGYYYGNKENGNLFWHDGDYTLWLTGDLDKEALVRAALSVRIK